MRGISCKYSIENVRMAMRGISCKYSIENGDERDQL